MKKLITSFFIKLFNINKEDLLAASSEKKEELKDTGSLPHKESVETSLSVGSNTNDSNFIEPVFEKKKTVKQKKILLLKTCQAFFVFFEK